MVENSFDFQFYHFLDIAHVNAFILFEDFRKKHVDIPEDLTDKIWTARLYNT